MARQQKSMVVDASLSQEKPSMFAGQFKKTKLCRFNETGRCRYDDACPFAHSQHELEDLPDLSKTSMCKNWLQGCCSNTSGNCTFAHGKEELRKTPLQGKRKGEKNLRSTPAANYMLTDAFKDTFGLLDRVESSTSFGTSSFGTSSFGTRTPGDSFRADSSASGEWSGSDRAAQHRCFPASYQEGEDQNAPLNWDPLGLCSANQGTEDFGQMHWVFPEFPEVTLPVKNHEPMPRIKDAGVAGKLRQKKDRDLRRKTRMGGDLTGLLTPIYSGYTQAENMMVPGMGGNHMMMVPANTVMWDMPSCQPNYNTQDVEYLLRMAMPEHYED